MNALSRLPLTRRSALLGLASAFTLGRASLAFGDAPTENRFVVVLLRGALDGMSAVQPYGDPDFASLRGPLALPPPGQPGGVLDLGGFHGLHPALASLHAMYANNDALILHAVAGHYRSRSHFEAQDYLESGVDQRLASGWLNRAVAATIAPPGREMALSLGLSAPLLLRGPAPVQAWAPEHFAQPDADLYTRLVRLAAADPIIGPALAEGVRRRGLGAQAGPDQGLKGAAALAAAAGRLLAMDDGPRVAVLELGGWDTHAAQLRRLADQFAQLDTVLGVLRAGLGDAWKHTAILAVTEFGRTARINGTNGTDHGTAGAAFVLGGAVAGGRVRADWPGLAPGKLFENRDLAPTGDVRSIAKGLLAAQLGLNEAALALAFPGSRDAPPMTGLTKTG